MGQASEADEDGIWTALLHGARRELGGLSKPIFRDEATCVAYVAAIAEVQA